MMSRNAEYLDAMQKLTLSDDAKNRMIQRMITTTPITSISGKKRNIGIKKYAVLAAACIMTLGLIAAAFIGNPAKLTSKKVDLSGTRHFENLTEYEKAAQIDISAVEAFNNGYKFQYMYLSETNAFGGDSSKISKEKAVNIHYTCENKADLEIHMNPVIASAHLKDSEDAQNATDQTEIDGITLYYSLNEYLSVPVAEKGTLTNEELERAESDNHFFIYYGSLERKTTYASTLLFEMDNVIYLLETSGNDLAADDLYSMAKEIIEHK
ncbi:MAG: hypothetical protein K6A23_12700 [Butyrivibrio sp.]|nr:hypothetical protein [Butyrivibrio sp.]